MRRHQNKRLSTSKLYRFECAEKNYSWVNSKITFDHVGHAYLALFQVIRMFFHHVLRFTFDLNVVSWPNRNYDKSALIEATRKSYMGRKTRSTILITLSQHIFMFQGGNFWGLDGDYGRCCRCSRGSNTHFDRRSHLDYQHYPFQHYHHDHQHHALH